MCAHQLFGERFLSNRKPAWHNLGVIVEEDTNAVDAFNRVTPFTVTLEPLYTEVGTSKLELAQKAIMRHPVPDDPEYKMLGIVGPDYHLVDPLRLCEIYDESVTSPVETLGALGSGETLFLTTRLPSFSVLGDDVDNFLLIVSPYGGNASIQVRLTPVRVVCSNTLMIAKRESTESYRIVHDTNAELKLSKWMGGIISRFQAKTEHVNETFEAMARVHVPESDVEPLLELIYVDPKRFSHSILDEDNTRREGWYEENQKMVLRRRQAVKEVFEGRGVGQDTPAAQGTVWGLWNSVAEYEAYKPTTKIASAAADLLMGSRGAFSEQAYSVLLQYTSKQTV